MNRGEVTERTDYVEEPLADTGAGRLLSQPESETNSPVLNKASASLKNRETQVIKAWLQRVIDSLGLPSLQEFPTSELTTGFPGVIQGMAGSIQDPEANNASQAVISEISGLLATLRKDDASLNKVIDDYSLLKRLMLEAAAADLRSSDRVVLGISQNLDYGFNYLMKEGLKAYIDQHSSELRQLADTDALTGLYNVRYFRHQLHQNLEMFKRYQIPFSLLMLDLDGLKQLNHVRGQQAGDRALKHLAAILSDEKRDTDVAVRYGGDEFFLVLPGTPGGDAERLAYRIVRRVRQLNIRSGGLDITGVSVGLVSCPANGADVGTLRTKADRAPYPAKAIGGASVAFYQEFREA